MATFALSIPHAGPRSFCLRPIRASSNGVPFLKPKSGGPTILEIPLDKIRRPLMRTRANDPLKVKELMESIRLIGLQEPVFLDATATRLISDLASQPFVVKSVAEQRRH
ncbi:sulfiredoxin, chloroplastic/mitochondrial-like isoform X3 [Zingiber officinale]|uniref:sulfiredoxin, chloroplastic/mitochondrial-like isoform X3 n=1 Tax=Zingiber officinale TaxID=94328 RepID=UPI001C4CE153|nr:sulfiredoxin, chloroplastic/mitochondrial-like isoform X3 [Zingiber officinale]